MKHPEIVFVHVRKQICYKNERTTLDSSLHKASLSKGKTWKYIWDVSTECLNTGIAIADWETCTFQ